MYQKTFETFDDTITVTHAADLAPGLVEIEIQVNNTDSGTPEISFLNLDVSEIDGLVEALRHAEKLARQKIAKHKAVYGEQY